MICRVRSVKKAAKAVAASVMAAYAGPPLAQKARHPAGRDRRAGRGAERIRGAAGRSPGERKHPAGAGSEERPVWGSGPDPPMVRPVAGRAGRRAGRPGCPGGGRPAGDLLAQAGLGARPRMSRRTTCGKPGCRRAWWISRSAPSTPTGPACASSAVRLLRQSAAFSCRARRAIGEADSRMMKGWNPRESLTGGSRSPFTCIQKIYAALDRRAVGPTSGRSLSRLPGRGIPIFSRMDL